MTAHPGPTITDPLTAEPLVVFHHIEKTAGSSLRLVVKDNYPPQQLLESYGAAFDNDWYRLWWGSFTAREKSDLRCVAGHSANHLLPALDRPFRVLSVLRDPVERVISLYHHLLGRHGHRKADAPGGGRAERGVMPLIDDEAWSMDDIYGRLAGGQEESSRQHKLFAPFFNGQLRAILRPHSDVSSLTYAEGSWPEGRLHLQTALEYMTRHYVVGLQEDIVRSIERFARELGWDSVFTPRVNMTAQEGRHEVSEETRALIGRYNALDVELYEHFRDVLGGGTVGAPQPIEVPARAPVHHGERESTGENLLAGFELEGRAVCDLGENLDEMAREVRQLSEPMIVETHGVRDESWPERYVRPMAQHLPHWCCLGRVTRGAGESGERRLWLAFALTDLAGLYERRACGLIPDGDGVVEVDLTRSSLSFLAEGGLAVERRDDPLSEESYRVYSERLAEHEARFAAGEPVALSMSGEAYWLALLCGMVELADDGGLAETNVYLRWMTRALEAGAVDPGLRYLLDDRAALEERASLRLSALERTLRSRDPSRFPDMPIMYNATPSHPELERLDFDTVAVGDSEELLSVPTFDGHHRLFVLELLGVERCPMMTVWDPARLGAPELPEDVQNYELRMYQYLGGVDVDDPIVVSPGTAQPLDDGPRGR